MPGKEKAARGGSSGEHCAPRHEGLSRPWARRIKAVGRIPTALSTVYYSLEEKEENMMAKRHSHAYTFRLQGTRQTKEGAIRILITADHPIVRHGLKQSLAADPDATVAGEPTNGDEALELARKVECDMAIS